MNILRKLMLWAAIATATQALCQQAQTENHCKFTWGADAGASVDVVGNDMSTLALNAYFGWQNPYVDIMGVGAGIDMMVSNNARAFPLFGILRTSFRDKPSLCFMDLRFGAVLNEMWDTSRKCAVYASPGVGFNLAFSKKFKSYIIISYTYNGLKFTSADADPIDTFNGLHSVDARIGISF